MPLIGVQVMEGVFSSEDKKQIIEKLTKAFGEVAGSILEASTSVRIHEVQSGAWGYAGIPIRTEDAKAWRSKG